MSREKRSSEEQRFLDTISPRLKRAYHESGFTSVKDLAEEMDNLGYPVHWKTLEQVLNGRSLTSIFIFDGLCRALRVSTEKILTGVDPTESRDEQLLAVMKAQLKRIEAELSNDKQRREYLSIFDQSDSQHQRTLLGVVKSIGPQPAEKGAVPDAEE